jgi:hypothetical protein
VKKIPTLYVRDENDRKHVTREVTPGCEWVLAGEGVATRKFDGICFMFDGADWWARRIVKDGADWPSGFVVVDHDLTMGKTVGWEPATNSGYHKYLLKTLAEHGPVDGPGTYELCGPKINGDPEQFGTLVLIPHGKVPLTPPLDWDGLRDALLESSFEGIVWWRNPSDPDCDKAKLKRRDFS